ncbi:MAG: formyltransferase family protein [Patescibacteria group bacterium]
MKLLLVTSTITYTPKNYEDVLGEVINYLGKQIVGVVLVNIDASNVLRKAAFLHSAGCTKMARTLMQNLAREDRNEKINLIRSFNLPYLLTRNVNNQETISWIKKEQPDLVFNIRARDIYRKEMLEISKLGCVNIHHGLLPRQRGLFCDLRALANDEETGFTIHRMTDKVDQGEIFIKIKNKSNPDYVTYLAESAKKESREIIRFIEKVGATEELPLGTSSMCNKPINSTTPSLEVIRNYQKRGLIL